MAVLRNFSEEGYAYGGAGWARTNAVVRQAIKDDLQNFERSTGKMPTKWLRTIKLADDQGTTFKVKKIGGLMTLLIHQGSRCRIVRDVAKAIVNGYKVPPKDFVNEFWAIQHWVQQNIRYSFDLGEIFQTPQRVLIDWYRGQSGADCDCETLLALAMFRSLGHMKIAIGLLDSRGDGTLSHAIALVKLPKAEPPFGDKWIPMEFTKEKPFSWVTPKASKIIVIPVGQGRYSSSGNVSGVVYR